LEKIQSLTLQSWNEEKTEAPLKIAVTDMENNSPLSLAFLRGHHDAARGVLDIAKAQYAPEDKEKSRYRMETDEDGDDSYNSGDDEESDSDAEPRIVATAVDKKFTIENIGQVSMQVKSRTKPLQLLFRAAPSFKVDNAGKLYDLDNTSNLNLFRFVIKNDDLPGLKTLLDFGIHFASQKFDGEDEEEATGYFNFPEDDFQWAVEHGKTRMLAEIIKRTGAGMPLDHLVKKSGVEMKDKPRFYQGLTVYGKKR
jgi:hypothetical protein